jgi:hypothetical protein
METNQTESVIQSDESSASTDNKTTLNDSNDRYKKDMFKFKDENKTLKDQLRELQLVDEQKKGNLEGVITSLKDEIKGLKNTNAQTRLGFATTQLDGAIKQELAERGLKGAKLDAFMKLVDDNDRSIVELDESFNAKMEDITNLVDKGFERYGDLFKKEVKIVDGVPKGNNFQSSSKIKNVEDMNDKEVLAYLKTLKD